MGLIDAHNHLPRGLTLETLIRLMDEANVSRTVLMTVYYGATNPQGQGISDENLVLEFYKKQPDRIIPFLGMQRPSLTDMERWLKPDATAENLLTFAEARLKTGLYRGMGEFILGHYPYLFPSGARGGTVKIPADTPLMRRFLDLAAKYHVPVTVHYEIDPESLPSLERMLGYGRQTTIILAHNCGRPDPTTLKALLDKYPNLFCDLGGVNPSNAYGRTTEPTGEWVWFVKNPISDSAGRLRPEWKALYEQYADRFVGIGLDSAHPEAWTGPQYYGRVIAEFRRLLADLSPETAGKIGYKNAQRLLVPIPLIDAHNHWTPELATETVISRMDQGGVRQTVLMATDFPNDWPIAEADKLVLEMYERNPGRIIPFLSAVKWGWAVLDGTFLEYADRQLARGKFRGIGEFMARIYGDDLHPSRPGPSHPDISVPVDSPWGQDLMCLAAKYNVPLVVHMETTPETLLALDRALQKYTDAKVIWAHQSPIKTYGGRAKEYARADPDHIATLLERHPNLFADIMPGMETEFLSDADIQLPEKWKALYEKYSDRFVVGMDTPYAAWWENNYFNRLRWMHWWLAQLSEDTQKKLAYENIERILTARPSPGQTCQFLTAAR